MRKHLLQLIYEKKNRSKIATVITSLSVDEDVPHPYILYLAKRADAKVRETHKDLGKLADYRYLGIEDDIRILVGDDDEVGDDE